MRKSRINGGVCITRPRRKKRKYDEEDKENAKKYYQENKERIRAQQKEYRKQYKYNRWKGGVYVTNPNTKKALRVKEKLEKIEKKIEKIKESMKK